jgi:ornithine carbamoyltransferase
MSRYVDAIMIRILSHDDLLELAGASSIPVINGLTSRSHPAQVMADIMTYEEHKGSIKNTKVTWLGDANNVLLSWIHAAKIFDINLTICTPDEYSPNQAMLADIALAGKNIQIIKEPSEAAYNADLIVTDTWVSMGDKDADERRKILSPYRVDISLMQKANKDAIFMHCLPAHRGDEVTNEVIDGAQSVVFDEAENRLHIQKAIICWVFGIESL